MGLPDSLTIRKMLAAIAVAAVLGSGVQPVLSQTASSFASRIAQLSEHEGAFDADNLVSNERSYLHVISSLRDAGVSGGAYIGVGPDQNFTYIAQIRPTIAFIIDIRRDNLLLHLLFKALFSLANTRAEYMSLLFGRPAPEPAEEWRDADITRLIAHIDDSRPAENAADRVRARVDAAIKTFGVPLSAEDLKTIDRFHRAFIEQGLGLKFEVNGRASAPGFYPTYRQLLLETDREGKRGNFLTSEGDYQFVRSLERRDLVIPVVGDLGGSGAVANIGRLLTSRGERVSAFYASNVEYYLAGEGKYSAFLANLRRLPRTNNSVIIRSIFGGYVLPQTVRGYSSTSLTQPMSELLDGFTNGRYHSYDDLLLFRRD